MKLISIGNYKTCSSALVIITSFLWSNIEQYDNNLGKPWYLFSFTVKILNYSNYHEFLIAKITYPV